MINNKGLTDEEIQKIIDWKIECSGYDKMMWKLYAEDMIKKIFVDSIGFHGKNKPKMKGGKRK